MLPDGRALDDMEPQDVPRELAAMFDHLANVFRKGDPSAAEREALAQLMARSAEQMRNWARFGRWPRSKSDDERMTVDAARWRALIGSARIRIIGTARLGTREGHVSVELWGRYPDADPDRHVRAVQTLTSYADGLR
jgi:hypothetical protein